MGFVFGIFGMMVPVAMAAGVVSLGKWILGPFEAAARRRRKQIQFTLADFLSLMFLVQLPMAGVHGLFSYMPLSVKIMLDSLGVLICSVIWGYSVKKLSDAGITSMRHRMIFLTFVLPMAYFGTFVVVVTAPIAVIIALAVREDALVAGELFLVDLCLFLGFYLSANFVRRMVTERSELKVTYNVAHN